MEKKNNKVLLEVIGLAILLISVVGITYSFFNYTRTGQTNTVKTGNISFNSTQDNTINLTNVFPTSSANLNSTNSDTVTINITGDTTYNEGIEYKVTLDQVNNTINGKEVPISIRATANNLGTEDNDYYTNRTNKTKIYMLNSEGEAYNGKYIAVGYIPSGSTGVNGSIDITAFIDTNKVAISDTYDGTESDLMGTTNDWVMGREVFTTEEWNSFQNTPLSFKVKVEANEGIWIEKEKFLTMKNLNSIQEWENIKANITSIEFHKNGVAPNNPVTSFDVTDTTSDPSKGNITLYTVDDGLGNNTYKAIVVANDTIYAPENCANIFKYMTKLEIFNSKNFKVDNVTTMQSFFYGNEKLKNIKSLSDWNTINVINMQRMFASCFVLEDISPLSTWNTKNVTNMRSMFNLVQMQTLESIKDWDVQNVTIFTSMFLTCSNLNDSSSINAWNINAGADFTNMFYFTPSHPEFSKFPNGTWDENGTFSPNA